MLINSDTLNTYFICRFYSLVFSRDAHLTFMSYLRVSAYTVMLQPAPVSHVHNVEHSNYNPQQHITVAVLITQCPIAVFHVIHLRQAIPD